MTMRITAAETKTEPKYKTIAPELLERCREFFQDDENERAYQEWKAGRGGKHEKAAV